MVVLMAVVGNDRLEKYQTLDFFCRWFRSWYARASRKDAMGQMGPRREQSKKIVFGLAELFGSQRMLCPLT